MSAPRNRTVVWGRQVLVGLAILVASAIVVGQSITVPNTFVNGTVADANQVNSNFSALASNALNRNAGTMLGTLNTQAVTPTSDATYDLGTGAFRFRDGFFSRNLTAGAGAVGAPSVAVGGTDRGMWSSGTDALEFSTKGIKALGIDSTQFVDSPTQPRVRAYNSADIAFTTGTDTALAMNTETFDVGTLHDTVTNNTRLTVPTGGDGLYLIQGQLTFALNATGERRTTIRKNGATTLVRHYHSLSGVGQDQSITVATLAVLAAGDYVEILGLQTSGGNLNLRAGDFDTYFELVKLW